MVAPGGSRERADPMPHLPPISPSPPKPMMVFVDETFFHSQTGVIQVGIPFPSYLEHLFNRDAADIIKGSRQPISEFKASQISKGNAEVYKKFLELILRKSGMLHEQVDLHPIVTFESYTAHAVYDAGKITRVVSQAWKNLNVCDVDPHFVAEFSRQVAWINCFFEKILPNTIPNPFIFVFDNKHSYAQECQSVKRIFLPSGIATLKKQGELLVYAANAVLASLANGRSFPRVSQFNFEHSGNKYFLQAADLVCNLSYNWINYEKGIRTVVTELKHDMLQEVMPAFQLPSKLLDALEVKVDKHGDKKLLWRNSEEHRGVLTLFAGSVPSAPSTNNK
jgi:hypothetical protein